MELGETKVHIKQDSEFPWNGEINFSVNPEQVFEGTLAFRIPGLGKVLHSVSEWRGIINSAS
ncbi:beta-L-arabinofuranosidase domain-containing protein [Alkalicoccobacillus plakortidis]|uniref:beta-L-arabinofuranosidase domain-containing protein n=1 Tax=Alkalicoccobacillus plakortidis TaxID=444060 RepID=UPI00255824EE|nr:beta-L-arabinofuranosidase domain-containing protein [Alkalicoccobacillus plakortidis]